MGAIALSADRFVGFSLRLFRALAEREIERGSHAAEWANLQAKFEGRGNLLAVFDLPPEELIAFRTGISDLRKWLRTEKTFAGFDARAVDDLIKEIDFYLSN